MPLISPRGRINCVILLLIIIIDMVNIVYFSTVFKLHNNKHNYIIKEIIRSRLIVNNNRNLYVNKNI